MSLKSAFASAALIALAALPAAAAGPAPAGVKFRVSVCTNCSQAMPAVAGVPSGEFFVVWEGESRTDHQGVDGRLFKSNGMPKAADLQLNKTVVLPDQFDAAVAGNATGYVAVWSAVSGNDSDVVAQRYTLAGAPVGAAIPVNVDQAGPVPPADFNPVVAKTKDGGFVVVWVRFIPPGATTPGTNPEVLLRRFNKNGGPLGPQVKLNTGLVNGDRPDLCIDAVSGQMAVAWTSADGFPVFQPNHRGASARRVSAAGALLGPEIVVARPLSRDVPVGVSCGKNGDFVVVWQSDLPPSTDRADILGQRVNKMGRKLGMPFRVNSQAPGLQKTPAISHDPTGAFVVVWESDTDNGGGIRGRRFAATGAATGPDFAIDSIQEGNLKSIEPDVAHTGTGTGFVVVWQDGLKGIFGRRYTVPGSGRPAVTDGVAGAPEESADPDAASGALDLAEDPAANGRD